MLSQQAQACAPALEPPQVAHEDVPFSHSALEILLRGLGRAAAASAPGSASGRRAPR